MVNATQTGAATIFAANDIVVYTKSGKHYRVTGTPSASGPHRIGVVGWKDGREFGPIRFLDADKCQLVQRG